MSYLNFPPKLGSNLIFYTPAAGCARHAPPEGGEWVCTTPATYFAVVLGTCRRSLPCTSRILDDLRLGFSCDYYQPTEFCIFHYRTKKCSLRQTWLFACKFNSTMTHHIDTAVGESGEKPCGECCDVFMQR